MVNREWGNKGQNYLRSLLALGFQAFLIMICVGIYAVLVEGISLSGDNISGAIWGAWGTRYSCALLSLRPAASQNPCSGALIERS